MWSRACALGRCHLGAQWPFGKRTPDRESLDPVVTFGGMLVCPHWQVNVFVGYVAALAGPPASRPFMERALGEIRPLSTKRVGFSFSYIIYFNYYLRSLGSLALIFPLFLSLPQKGSEKKKSRFSAYWLRSSARVLFCAFS